MQHAFYEQLETLYGKVVCQQDQVENRPRATAAVNTLRRKNLMEVKPNWANEKKIKWIKNDKTRYEIYFSYPEGAVESVGLFWVNLAFDDHWPRWHRPRRHLFLVVTSSTAPI